MRMNAAVNIPKIYTHEGGVAKHITPEQQLRHDVVGYFRYLAHASSFRAGRTESGSNGALTLSNLSSR